jgi:branched-subunit amino acid transport protein
VALAAIVAPDLLVSGGAVSLSWTNTKLIAGVAAIAFFLWTRQVLGTLVFGMVVFTLLRLAG